MYLCMCVKGIEIRKGLGIHFFLRTKTRVANLYVYIFFMVFFFSFLSFIFNFSYFWSFRRFIVETRFVQSKNILQKLWREKTKRWRWPYLTLRNVLLLLLCLIHYGSVRTLMHCSVRILTLRYLVVYRIETIKRIRGK